MPTHFVFESVARRLDAGAYSLAVARAQRAPVAAPTRPVAHPFAGMATVVAPYVGSALLGAILALAFQVQP